MLFFYYLYMLKSILKKTLPFFYAIFDYTTMLFCNIDYTYNCNNTILTEIIGILMLIYYEFVC